MAIYGSTITNFATQPQSEINIGGVGYNVQDAGKSYSLQQLDSTTARFEIQAGDQAWYDGGSGVDRSMLSGSLFIPPGTPTNIHYQWMMEPGPTNAASWMVTGEVHSLDTDLANSSWHSSPPIAIQLTNKDQLQIVARYAPSGVNPSDSAGNDKVMVLWTSPTPIVRGQYYDINMTYNASNDSSGYLKVAIDGQQVVNYSGPLGYGTRTYFEEGIYRSTTNQDQADVFRNLTISTGADALAAASGSIPSSGTSSGSTTTPTSPTAPVSGGGTNTPSATEPALTIADNSLWVAGRGGTVDLGTTVTPTDSNDRVALHITGLPRYETITDNLDGQTFRGSDINLTASQVNSGLVLQSFYRGGGLPVATLTLNASATDPTTGAVSTASPQTITVTDPRPARSTTAATTTTLPQTIDLTDHLPAATANTGFLASRAFALLQQHVDPAATTLATTGRAPIFAADHPVAPGASAASQASHSFALLNQYLAGNTGRVDPGQIVAAVSQATGWGQESLLARPQH
ncbi:heparin lyase I family protein [Bradyrhizobium sp. PMVTL-01]|uniref:heparin lyase I family protein n=1 Tax=Bradyrhizobium sp. PMVTL-01 TaxID=3434999 RepID=UPI003F6E4892